MTLQCPHCKKLFQYHRKRILGKTLRERFMQQVFEAPNGCWIWMGLLERRMEARKQ